MIDKQAMTWDQFTSDRDNMHDPQWHWVTRTNNGVELWLSFSQVLHIMGERMANNGDAHGETTMILVDWETKKVHV